MLRKDVGLSHYSVMGTLVHILDTQWYRREGAQFGILPIEFISSSDFATVNELRRRWDKEDQLLLDFISGLADRELVRNVEYHWKGARPRIRPLWQFLQYIINRGTHHRSEIGNFLATQGESPKDIDFIKYVAKASHH